MMGYRAQDFEWGATFNQAGCQLIQNGLVNEDPAYLQHQVIR